MNKENVRGLIRGPFFCGLPAIFLLLSSFPLIGAEEMYIDAFRPAAHYAHTERENVRVYEGRSYQGLRYRGRRVYLQRSEASRAGSVYRGSVYLIKTLTRDAVRMLQPVDREIQVECRVSPKGFTSIDGTELPVRTGFPVLAEGEISPGDTWKADGIEAVFLDNGELVSQPFHCTYTYRGVQPYMKRTAQIIDFTYTFFESDPYGRKKVALRGKGEGEIALFTGDEGGYFIKERITRHYLENRDIASSEEGFRLTWGRGITLGEIQSLERTMVAALEDNKEEGTPRKTQAQDDTPQPGTPPKETLSQEEGEKAGAGDEAGPPDIEVERTTEGIKLNLPRIHFYPDQAKILPREKDRLDKLARLLKKVPEASFMVKGHTADVGTKESQYELSVERARTIIEEMVERGLGPSRFVYQGLGGDKPVATNDTEEGRKQNRRVEVIILNK